MHVGDAIGGCNLALQVPSRAYWCLLVGANWRCKFPVEQPGLADSVGVMLWAVQVLRDLGHCKTSGLQGSCSEILWGAASPCGCTRTHAIGNWDVAHCWRTLCFISQTLGLPGSRRVMQWVAALGGASACGEWYWQVQLWVVGFSSMNHGGGKCNPKHMH